MKSDKFEEFLKQSDSKIVIFGATGWLGRECIALIRKYLKKNIDSRLILVASKSNVIEIGDTKLSVFALADFPIRTKCDLVLDFSFITQEKMIKMGEKEYVLQNTKLTQGIRDYVAEMQPSNIYYASSGAADPNFLMKTNSPSKKVYGELKLEAEFQLEQICSQMDSQLLINRIWSLTGTQMLEPHKYAIGDFITQALNHKQIVIKSSDQILRSYIDAADLLDACFNYLLNGNSGLVNSGGYLVSLLELANYVSRELNTNEVLTPNLIPKQSDEDYFSPDFDLNDIANKYGMQLQDIEKQVKNTISAINS